MLFGAIVALIIFLFRELKSKSPLLQLRLFRYRNYVASALIAFIFGAGMFGSLYIIPVLVQTIQGFGFQGGSNAVTWGYCFYDCIPTSRRLSTAVDPSHTIAVGLAIFGLSCWLLADIGMLTGFWVIALLVAFGRIGLGLAHAIFKLKQHELSSGRFSSVCCWYAELHTNDRRFDRSECACYYY